MARKPTFEELEQKVKDLEKEAAEGKKAERAVQEVREYAESIVDTVRELLVVLDADLRVISASRSFYQAFQVIPEETKGQLLYDLGNRQWDIPKLRELLEQILPKNSVFDDLEVEHYFETIGRRTMILNARRLYREANQPGLILLAIEDTTERKRAEEKLRKHREHLEGLVEERTAELAKANEILESEITERKQAEEQIRRKTAVVEAINKVFQETLVCETEEEVAYVCINMAEELTGSEYGLIGEVNEAGRFDTITYGDLGWAICKIPESDAVALSKDMEIRGIWGQAILKGKSQMVNDPASHPNRVGVPEGHPQISSFLGVPLKYAGRTFGMIGLANKEGGYEPADQEAVESLSVPFVEALRRKRAEKQLKKYSEELEEMVEERTKELRDAQEDLVRSERLATLGQFSGNISHELRNPLGVIDSSAYYLKTKLKNADKKVQEHLDRIKSSVISSTAVIQSLLNLTRMKEPHLKRLNLVPIISDAIATSKIPGKVKVIQDLADQEILANGDAEQLRMAFKNIVRNAVDAMAGKGTLTVSVEKNANGKPEVSFADTGPGIAPENLDKIFQPLFSTKAKGIGFGLSIAKMIADKHGGTIEVKSDLGKGATITIELPVYGF